MEAKNDRGPSRELAFKAGFISLGERLKNLKGMNLGALDDCHDRDNELRAHRERRLPPGNRQTAQFATLHEFFQSKSSYMKQKRASIEDDRARRTKIPIMKLTKDDWNVKCWEERLSSRKRDEFGGPLRRLDQRQLEVFQGRIEEVASKLDKVREGAPLDEQLAKLLRARQRPPTSKAPTSGEANGGDNREWINLLKEELLSGTHNPRVLRERVHKQLCGAKQNNVSLPSSEGHNELGEVGDGETQCNIQADNDFVYGVKLAHLGRPVRRLFDDDDED